MATPAHSMHFLLKSLLGGDRRSIGAVRRAVEAVLMQPPLLAVLFDGLYSDDPLLRMRCADAIEKATVQHHDWLPPFKAALLGPLAAQTQKEVRWHVAALLARLPLSDDEARAVVAILLDYTNDASSIVKTMAMQALTDIAVRHPVWLAEVRRHITELMVIGSPAMQARGRKLLKVLAQRVADRSSSLSPGDSI